MTFQASVLTLLCLSSLGLVDGDERGRKEMGTSVLDVVGMSFLLFPPPRLSLSLSPFRARAELTLPFARHSSP